MGNYLMPFKEEDAQKLLWPNIFFRSRCVETVNNKCMRHNAIVLYVCHWPAYLGK